ncbi:MAG: methyltransferase domain-containing protein [Pseudomonadota bacterium]
MGFYSRKILPTCLDMACSCKPIRKQREKVVPQAKGTIVEVGIGSGLNLPFYNSEQVDRVIGIDPDEEIWTKAAPRVAACNFPVERIGLSGESILLDDESADTVLVTYALCTIPDPVVALCEMGRILKPGGEILFTEHGKAPDPKVARWQKRIDPIWKRLAGGCHTGRDIPALFDTAGLKLARLDEMYVPGPKVLSYNYWGAAVRT